MIKQCEKCNAFYNTKLYESCPVCLKSLSDVDITKRLRTPSDLDVPVLVMCPPVIQKIYVDNNPFMEEQESSEKKDFDFDKLMQQWLIIYQTLASRYLVLTLPPNPLLQDLTWTNQAAYLPHVDEPTCVISNFRAEGRQPESDIMEWFLQEMGYKTYRIPDPDWYWEGEPCCFDEETEILTDEGWKYFKDLTGKEKVLTYIPEKGILKWQRPIAFYKKYVNELVVFENSNLQIKTSRDHVHFVRKSDGKTYDFMKAEDLVEYSHFGIPIILGDFIPEKEPTEKVVIPAVKYNNNMKPEDLAFELEDWVKFMAWFLSEGYVKYDENRKQYQVWITQSREANSEKYEEIYQLLTKMGFNVARTENALVINSKTLAHYLKQFGKAHHKYIPKDIKELPPKYLKIFINTFVKGDGCLYGESAGNRKGKWRKISSTSKRLIDDLQEIALKCGIPCHVKKVKYERGGCISGRTIKGFEGYELVFRHSFNHYVRKSFNIRTDRTGYSKVYIEKTNVYVPVYDVEVPEGHVLVVRRNGWPFLSGNCKFLRDNIYIGSYGMRTTEEALNWIAEKFDAKIIKVGIETEHNYHGDTIFCPISPTKVMIVIPFSDKKGLRELEKYAEIIPIEDQNLGKFCITNNVVIGYTIYAGTYIEELEPNTEEWEIEMKKIETLEMISAENGMDLVLFDISTFDDFGAALSCTVMRLNYPDRKSIDKWENYGKK